MTGMAPTFPVSSVGARNSLSSQLCKSVAQTHTQHPAKEYQLGSGNRSTCLRVCLRINIMYCVYTHAGTAYTQAFSTHKPFGSLWVLLFISHFLSVCLCVNVTLWATELKSGLLVRFPFFCQRPVRSHHTVLKCRVFFLGSTYGSNHL